uniref:Nuclear VCP like n=1 Tax=Rhinolophus ferrumequinum TaxID=59479 RepID=A0A671G4A9_RHIFE
ACSKGSLSSRACWTSLQRKTPRNSLVLSSLLLVLGSFFCTSLAVQKCHGNGVGQPGWDAFRVRLARRSPRAASGRPPVPVEPAAPAVEAESGGMKPRPSRFVDNKLKQRVMQYLTSNRCGKYVDTGVLASDLQRMYREKQFFSK